MAPANSASIADGPALKLFQSILTCGPMALANQPFALPIMACECVILGKAPTRIVVCWATTSLTNRRTNKTANNLIFIGPVAPMNHHRKYAALFCLALTFSRIRVTWLRSGYQIAKAGSVENLRG